MEYHDRTVADCTVPLALGQAAVEPLPAGEKAVLPGREFHDGVDRGRIGSEPERITHAYRGQMTRGWRAADR